MGICIGFSYPAAAKQYFFYTNLAGKESYSVADTKKEIIIQ